MFISLFLSCNNGIEDLERKNHFLSSLANLGNDFLDVFTSFGDSIGSVLNFDAKIAKKSDVGKYFKKVQDAVQGTKDKLEKLVADMKTQGNSNASAVETAVNDLIGKKLSKIIEGATIVSEALKDVGDAPLGDVGTAQSAPAGAKGDVENLINGIKSIVEVVLKSDEGKHDAGDIKGPVPDAGTAGSARNGGNGEAGKLFGTAAGANASDAVKAVSAVTSADILQAISKGVAATLAKDISGSASNGKKDAEVAGGIALRSLVKGGVN
ncbi:variable large family protein (plasmid) [Borrelia coriaceae]|uniref:Variable large protein n=1 Tax=Borrelia coriaceae ATCC 43381 TaxID=1408429 RepID=W5SXA5_9SPIR|nr:Variable outer membrane protein [Borrelia coriaceae ATCC 43381]UPA17357.1 variable large family protein [Borrelia coriaceae]